MFAWAALNDGAVANQTACGGPCRTDNAVVVEAHDQGDRAAFSAINGQLSAPGVGILSALTGNQYAAWNGTSMAAPHVSGLAAMLVGFDPGLSASDVTRILKDRESTRAVGNNGARGIDAFSTFVTLDQVRPGRRVQRSLIDTDDGNLDGNDRTSAASGFGDGHVTMRDFRRFRDALLQAQVEETILQPEDISLDGPANSLKRDLNRDRKLGDPARPENLYPRFDFNGDGVLRMFQRPAELFSPPNDRFRSKTDLEVLADAAVWETDAEDVSVALAADGGDEHAPADPLSPAAALRADRDADGIIDYLRSVDLSFTLTFAGGAVTDDFTIRILSYDATGTRFLRVLRYVNPACGPEQEPPIPAGQTVRHVVTVPIYSARRVDLVVSGVDRPSCSAPATPTVGSFESLTSLKLGQDIARTIAIP
jgi:hypothetical protein